MNSDLEERVAEVKVAAKDLKYKATQVMWGRMKYASDAQELTLASVKRIERMFDRSTVFETIDKIVRENCELILGDGMKRELLLFHDSWGPKALTRAVCRT